MVIPCTGFLHITQWILNGRMDSLMDSLRLNLHQEDLTQRKHVVPASMHMHSRKSKTNFIELGKTHHRM